MLKQEYDGGFSGPLRKERVNSPVKETVSKENFE